MRIDKDKLVKNFCELVRIDSPSGEEEKIRDYLSQRLNKLGAEIKVDKSGNLLAKINGFGEPVILSAHMDTVEPGRGVKPNIREGIIVSDGKTILGADNKIAIACILYALESIEVKKRRSLEIVFSVREETDGGISDFDFFQLRGKTGILADRSAPVGSIVTASPWIENLEITFYGKASHAGMPEAGINALSACAEAISKTKWGRIDKKTTSNLGLIKGGSAMNTLPDSVFLQGEVRSFSNKKLYSQLEKIKDIFTGVSEKYDAKINFVNRNYCHGYEYKRSDLHVRDVVKVMKELKINPSFQIAFGGSDANTFVKKGIKLVNIGDGSKNPHSVNESIEISEMVKLAAIFSKYITYD